jgi:hypothetical protein
MAAYDPNDPYGIGAYYGGDFSPYTPAQEQQAAADQNMVNNYYNGGGVQTLPYRDIPTAPPAAPAGPSAEDVYWKDKAAREIAAADELESRRVRNALASAKTFFDTYGMSALWGGVEALIRGGYNDADTISGILSRDSNYQTAYFSRFPAVQAIRELNKTRLQQGLTIMAEPSPASYVGLEEGYRKALVGLPTGLWGSSADVSDWIVKDVSPEEVASRVTTAKNYINYSANASIKGQLRQIYGMTDQEMTAYVLDEDRALGFIENEYQSRMRKSTIGAAAIDSGLSISDTARDQLAGNDTYGSSYGNALAGFQSIAESADAYSQLGRMSGITTNTDELVSDQFGIGDAAGASKKKKMLSSQERARFGGSAGVGAQSLNAKPLGSA